MGNKLVLPDPVQMELPSGYRYSTLAKNITMGIGLTSDWLVPALIPSNLGFKDLALDKNNHVSYAHKVKS
jgi:hypothetical protein